MVGAAPQANETRVEQTTSTAPFRLAAGTELLGEYEASAFTQPRYLLRRSDGQVIQLTRLLYLVVAALDSGPGVDLVPQVSVDNINYLIDQKLAPLGVIAAENDSDKDVSKLQAVEALPRANP